MIFFVFIRYFIVEPGILKYANAPCQPIKETFPLNLCSIRFSAADPLRVEVEHPHGVLYLRMPSGKEKRSWIESLQKAKHIFHPSRSSSASGGPTTTVPFSSSAASFAGSSAACSGGLKSFASFGKQKYDFKNSIKNLI